MPWNGVTGKNLNIVVSQDFGYCTHGEPTFPTWHRPYLAMLEQALYIRMFDIARQFDEPHRNRYETAAQEFRLPYWDYYRPRGTNAKFPGVINNGSTADPYDYGAPRIVTQQQIMIPVPPRNEIRQRHNPLCYYVFKGHRGTIPNREWDILSKDVSGSQSCKYCELIISSRLGFCHANSLPDIFGEMVVKMSRK